MFMSIDYSEYDYRPNFLERLSLLSSLLPFESHIFYGGEEGIR